MKVNTEFLKQEIEITQKEQNIISNYIEKMTRKEYCQVLENTKNLELFNALSVLRENSINWYNFKKESNILEVNSNFGEITGYLCSHAKKVVLTQPALKKCEAISKRYEDISNLEIFAGEIRRDSFVRKI